VIVTHARHDLCDACLRGLFRNTSREGLEVVVVDNGSSDGTAEVLGRWSASEPALRVIRNARNVGFAPAVNQGIRASSGEVVVILNDDTVVAPGWLPALVRHLQADRRLGVVCPVTNEIGNGARVPVDYSTLEGMEAFARRRALSESGRRRALPVVALFCAAMRRAVLDEVGLLDERYAVGLFEDDDLALSLEALGYTSAVADDAFVHHVGQASFGRLSDADYLSVWRANRARFEAKWGRRWQPPRAQGH
jgi:GT2 family glycosyltransferase